MKTNVEILFSGVIIYLELRDKTCIVDVFAKLKDYLTKFNARLLPFYWWTEPNSALVSCESFIEMIHYFFANASDSRTFGVLKHVFENFY